MKNILVIRFSSLGDVVLTTGVIKYVKSQINDINVDVLTMTPFASVFADNPYIRNTYCINKGAELEELIDVINSMPTYDAVFDLHSNLRSFVSKIALPAKSYTYEKNSFARRLYSKFRLFSSRLSLHTVEKYFEPFHKVFPILTPPIEELRPFIKSPFTCVERKSKLVTIHPFASKGGKIWPYFYDLCNVLLDSGIRVRVIGNGQIELPEKAENMIGFTPLNNLIRNIADSDVLVSTDSGPMHIGVALNIPTVAIFGPTTRQFGFYPSFKHCKVLEDKSLKCRPCDIHGPEECPLKHFRCMRSISVEEVRHHVLSFLKKD